MKYAMEPSVLESGDMAMIAWEAIAPLWDDLPLSPPRKLEMFLAQLTEGQRALIALDWCQKEIRNGGFQQLFQNSSGNLVPWAITGCRLIGADKYAALLSEAALTLAPTYPLSASARRAMWKSLSSSQKLRISNLEEAFLKLLESTVDDIEQVRGGYVKGHPDQFVRATST